MVGFAWAYSLRLCANQDLGIRSDRVTCRHKNLTSQDVQTRVALYAMLT